MNAAELLCQSIDQFYPLCCLTDSPAARSFGRLFARLSARLADWQIITTNIIQIRVCPPIEQVNHQATY